MNLIVNCISWVSCKRISSLQSDEKTCFNINAVFSDSLRNRWVADSLGCKGDRMQLMPYLGEGLLNGLDKLCIWETLGPPQSNLSHKKSKHKNTWIYHIAANCSENTDSYYLELSMVILFDKMETVDHYTTISY